MQLYYAPDSIATASHIVLAESGLDYALVKVDHHIHVNEDGSSYLEISPNGYVPALRLETGEILTETLAILPLIADRAPGSGLCPPIGTAARYRVLAWASYVATEIHQKFMRFTIDDLSRAQYAATIGLLKQRVHFAEAQIAKSGFFEGDRPTIADFFLYTAMRWFSYHGIPLSEWPGLAGWHAAIVARPAVQRALQEEGLAA